ncbi:MAG: hypothetical protein JO211_12320 [Acidobacteriaceae bacterium]|nr:hypothetical protein [Acidobacteriaceae bacterium]
MTTAGLLLMVAGWVLVLAAVILLVSTPSRTVFVCAGLGVEILGFVLVARRQVKGKSKGAARD